MTHATCSHCHKHFSVLGIQPNGTWFCSYRCVRSYFSSDKEVAIRTQEHQKTPEILPNTHEFTVKPVGMLGH